MIENLKQNYEIEQKNKRLFKIHIKKEELITAISFISSNTNFITLSQITCTDWIEDEVFALNYILTTDVRDKNLMVEVNISRENSELPTLMNLFSQAEVMERDLY